PFWVAFAMMFELCAYGFLTGLFYKIFAKKIPFIYVSLVIAMLGGRIVYGVFMALISAFGLTKDPFTFAAFIAAEFTGCVPGTILQLIAIPLIMLALDRTHMVPFRKKESAEKADA
ncbi:MAG: ECF transporter S component, partial [Clostridia bacterium]|nr:ECF transporter S component [Clostridia bacterium]